MSAQIKDGAIVISLLFKVSPPIFCNFFIAFSCIHSLFYFYIFVNYKVVYLLYFTFFKLLLIVLESDGILLKSLLQLGKKNDRCILWHVF
jgi:lipoprotein